MMPTQSSRWSRWSRWLKWPKLLNTISNLGKLLKKQNHSNDSFPIGEPIVRRSSHGEISLADLLIATNDLPWENEKQLKRIAESLGFAWQESFTTEEQPGTKPKGAYDHNAYDTKPRLKKKRNKPHLPDTAPSPPELPIELSPQAQLISGTLQPRDAQEAEAFVPNWLTEADQTKFPSLLSNDQSLPELKRDDLFSNNTSRGILSASLAVQRRGKEPDIAQIIDSIVRGKILKDIPRTTTSSMDQGCQLLLDYNETMIPYWQDLNTLTQQVENVVGREQVHLYEFDKNPLEAKHWMSRKQSEDWQTTPGKPVLVASNIGQTPHKQSVNINNNWHEFIQQCQQNHMPLLILMPWQKSLWPTDLGSYPIFIHWNPKTTASMVRQLIGKGHKADKVQKLDEASS